MIKESVTYQRYFWDNALWALKTGHFVRSNKRAQYEADKKNGMLAAKVKDNDVLIEKISQQLPIVRDRPALQEQDILDILKRIESSGARLKRLLTRPQ